MRDGGSHTTLAGFAAALLPAEAGGPPAADVAEATGRLLAKMPPDARAAVLAGTRAVEAASLVRHGPRLHALDPARRAAVLEGVHRLGAPGAALTEALKAVVLLAWGAEAHSEEIAATGNGHEPRRPDPPLDLTPAEAWPELVRCDAIVIGSGAGGAFAARELARAGLDTVIVEEGERWGVERIRAAHPIERFGSLYRGAGTTITVGSPAVTLPIGRAVGGTTVVNSGTCYRPPAGVRQRWYREAGLRIAEPERLEARLDDAEETVAVASAPRDVIGRNAELALAGAEALGWKAAPLRRNAPGCRGSCQCAIGCPNNAKYGVHLNALPQACEAGARIVSGLRVTAVLADGGRATGIAARRRDGSRLVLRAPTVVVAAGATETPPLLRRSGLARHRRMGYGLSIHPALGVAGHFDEPVVAWRGVLQSVGVEELHSRHGILIEATASPPGMGSMLVPGYGAELLGRLDGADHIATLGAMIADPPSGRVVGARRSTILYRLARSSGRRLVIAMGAMAEILLAAGARSVELGGGAQPVSEPAEIERELERVDMGRLHLAAFHPTGTVAAGGDPGRHPVDPDGRLRGMTGLWVADGSILPSCPGVNPQISIMALAGAVGENAAAS